jgi:hypothetical protein
MKRQKYISLRTKAYKLAGEVGTLAELGNMPQLDASYEEMCRALDSIDELGVSLGYIDPETNDLIDKRFKLERGDRMNR